MENEISILRIVSNIYSDDLEKSKEFYTQFLDMELVMDMGWILTFASKQNRTAQISILKNDKGEKVSNNVDFLSIEVDDIDAMYEKAMKHEYVITYEIADESWGVRRFFLKDPNGVTINILSHSKKQ